MAAFATPTELATYLRTATEAEATAGSPDLLDTTVAQLLLDNASAAIRAACGWNITTETVSGEPLYGWASGMLFLPTMRLTALALTVDSVTVTDFTWDRDGSVWLGPTFTAVYNSTVAATYTHGYATVPPDVKAVCLEQAAAAYPNPSRYRSETVEGVATVYAAGDLTQEPRLNKYRLPPGVA